MAVLDEFAAPEGHVILRLAADEMFVLGNVMLATRAPAIIEPDAGFAGWWLTPDELAAVVHHVEWALPTERPALAQGLVAGVPAALYLTGDRSLLFCASAYVADLRHRLSEDGS